MVQHTLCGLRLHGLCVLIMFIPLSIYLAYDNIHKMQHPTYKCEYPIVTVTSVNKTTIGYLVAATIYGYPIFDYTKYDPSVYQLCLRDGKMQIDCGCERDPPLWGSIAGLIVAIFMLILTPVLICYLCKVKTEYEISPVN